MIQRVLLFAVVACLAPTLKTIGSAQEIVGSHVTRHQFSDEIKWRRPRPIAYWSQGAHDWSQGAHDGWGGFRRSRRTSPTPDELADSASNLFFENDTPATTTFSIRSDTPP